MNIDAFNVRDEVNIDERVRACAELMEEWKRLEAEWAAGDKFNVSRWFPGSPGRVSPGGVGGRRFLGMTPEPVLWFSWEGMVANHRNGRGLVSGYVDAHGGAVGCVGRRAKPLSPGGDTGTCS